MKVFIGTMLLFLLSGTGVPGAEQHGNELIKELEERLSDEREKLEASHGREKDLIARIGFLDSKVKLGKEKISRFKEQIIQVEKEQQSILEKLESLEGDIAARREAVAEKLQALYKHARGGYARMLFGVEGLDSFRRIVKYMTSMMEEDARILDSQIEAARRQDEKKSAFQSELTEKRALREAQLQSLADLEAHVEKTVFDLVNIHKEKEFYETAIKELQLAAGKLKGAMAHVERDPVDGKPAEPREHGDDLPGSLALPAEGVVIVPGAAERDDDRQGVFVEVEPGAEVWAVLPGRVEFSGVVEGYGRTVIINHGGRLYTVSSNLGGTDVALGATVEAGEKIGVAGEKGGRGVLYFEIRQGGSPVDARVWLKTD